MGCCLSRGWAYGCRGFVLVPGVQGGGSCAGVVAAVGKKFLAACKIHHILFFFKYPVHNRSCNHDPTKFAAGPGNGGGPVGESARTEMCEIGTCEFLRGFPGDSGTSNDGWEYG